MPRYSMSIENRKNNFLVAFTELNIYLTEASRLSGAIAQSQKKFYDLACMTQVVHLFLHAQFVNSLLYPAKSHKKTTGTYRLFGMLLPGEVVI